MIDTDHVCGVCGDRGFVWESFLRGHNVIFMDDLSSNPAHVRARVAMGRVRALADRVDLAHMHPSTRVASTRYSLANEGAEYVVYQPESGSFTLDVGRVSHRFNAEWLDPSSGRTSLARGIRARGTTTFTPPFGGDAVLYLKAE